MRSHPVSGFSISQTPQSLGKCVCIIGIAEIARLITYDIFPDALHIRANQWNTLTQHLYARESESLTN